VKEGARQLEALRFLFENFPGVLDEEEESRHGRRGRRVEQQKGDFRTAVKASTEMERQKWKKNKK